MAPALPSYAYVFQEGQPKKHWPRLEADETFSIFLTKFWGKDIREEKRKWQEKWQETQTGADQMDTDEAPAKFAFSFNIKNWIVSDMWVREDYVLLYDYCTAHFAKPDIAESLIPPSVVITGQPGIGKTFWIYYAVRRRLGEKKPFIWYFAKQWYLFVEDGVFVCPGTFFPTPFDRVGLWVLADADHTTIGVPDELANPDSKLHTIFVSSPRVERWKPLLKTTSWSELIMNPWSWDEIYQAAIIHKLTSDQVDAAQRNFEDLGPTARFCINFVKNPNQLVSYERYRKTELGKLSMSSLKQAIQDSSTLNSNVSHSIFLVRRDEDIPPEHESYLLQYIIEPITSHMKRTLKSELMKARQEQRLDLYKNFEPVSPARRMVGIVYEVIGHSRFETEVKLTLVPMVKDQNARRKNTVWQSQFLDESGPRRSGAAIPIPISFKPQEIVEYKWPGPNVVNPSIYYVPESSNQVAFDSFMVDDRVLYIFQFTIALTHTIKAGIMDFLSQQSLQKMLQGKELRFVFIIPPGHKVECPAASHNKLEEFWKDVKLYSAVVDPKKEG